MELLVFGDTHIKPVDTAIDYDNLQVPADIDVVVSVGDVIHDTRGSAIDYGQKFFERLAGFDRPVVAVPGNHDPLEYYPQLTAELPPVVNAHKRVVTDEAFERSLGSRIDRYSFVGWGCEEFDQGPEIRPTDFPSLVPDRSGDRRYAADQSAQRLEDELYQFVTTDRTEKDLVSSLAIESPNRSEFLAQLDRTMCVYEEISSLLEDAEAPTIVLSHVPPYNTEADRHHSIGERKQDIEGLHVGSVGLKLALRVYEPLAAFHGHSHNPEYEVGLGESARPHSLNLGFQGIVRASLNSSGGSFGYERLA